MVLTSTRHRRAVLTKDKNMRFSKYLLGFLILNSIFAQSYSTINGIPNQLITVLGAPNSGTLPATCTAGAVYFKTGVTAGQNWYGCTSTNTWTLEGASTPFTDSTGNTSFTGDGTDHTLFTTSVTGGAIAAGKCLVIKYNITVPAVNTSVKIFYGGSSGQVHATLNNQTDTGFATLCNDSGVTNAQHLQIDPFLNSSGSVVQPAAASTTLSIDSTATQTLKMTANAASGTITGNSWIVR